MQVEHPAENAQPPVDANQQRLELVLFYSLAGLLTLVGLWPIWAADLLPLVDAAAHLHLMTVLHGIPKSALYQQHYDEVHALVPYLSYYKCVDILAHFVNLELANRVVLSLCIAAMPWSVLAYIRAVGHSRWLMLGVLPWMLHCDFFMGFFSYLMSIPLFFWLLAAHARWMQAPTRKRFFQISALLCLLALTHYLLWAVSLMLLPTLGVIFGLRRGWRSALWWPLRETLVTLPSIAILLPWFLRYFVFVQGVATSDLKIKQASGGLFKRIAAIYGGEHLSPLDNLRQIPDFMFDAVYRSDALRLFSARPSEILTLLWGSALLLWLLASAQTPVPQAANPEQADAKPLISPNSYAGWALGLIGILYFIFPRNLMRPIALYGVNFRFVEVIACLCVAALPLQVWRPPASARWQVRAGALMLVIAAIYLPVATALSFRQDRDVFGQVRAAYAAIPVGKSVLTLRAGRPSRWFLFTIGEYYAVFRQGYVPYSFADTSSKPIVVNRKTQLPAPPIIDQEAFTWHNHGRFYDYIAMYIETGMVHQTDFELPPMPIVFRAQNWTIYRNPQPDAFPEPTDDQWALSAQKQAKILVLHQWVQTLALERGLSLPPPAWPEDVAIAFLGVAPWGMPQVPELPNFDSVPPVFRGRDSIAPRPIAPRWPAPRGR